MSKFTKTICILVAFVSLFSIATGSRPLHASAPENHPTCDSFKLKMNDCSPYLKKHSRMAEPGTSCCSGVMDVWIVDSDCAEQVIYYNIVKLPNHLNETRVTHLSSACGYEISLDKYLELRLSDERMFMLIFWVYLFWFVLWCVCRP